MRKYALRYKWGVESLDEGYQKEDAGEDGLCDAMLGISIIFPEEGGYSQALFSFHGKEKRPLNQEEIFKVWMMLGLSLHDEDKLKGWKSDLVSLHSKMIRSFFHHSHNCPTKEKNEK